jgi:hypothetical protein
VKDREVDFIEGEAVGLGLLVGVIADAKPIRANCIGNVPNFHDFSQGDKPNGTPLDESQADRTDVAVFLASPIVQYRRRLENQPLSLVPRLGTLEKRGEPDSRWTSCRGCAKIPLLAAIVETGKRGGIP